MKYGIAFILVIISIGILISFESQMEMTYRSGTLDNDYIEEPITGSAEKYTKALEASNAIMDQFIKKDFLYIQENYIDPSMKGIITAEILKNSFPTLEKNYGKLKSYKSMQWYFSTAKYKDKDVVFSKKIAEHEGRMLYYIFLFADDGKYDKVIGIEILPR